MKHTARITAIMLTLFFLTQLIGLWVLDLSVDKEALAQGVFRYKDIKVGDYTFERPETTGSQTVGLMAFAIVIGTALIFLLMRLNWAFVWKLWFFSAIFGCLTFAFSALMQYPYPFILAFILALWRVTKPNFYVHNFTELFMYAGLALIFVPLLTIPSAIIMLLLISIYDAYAVWQSKHMVTLAKFQSSQGMFAGMVVPYSISKQAPKKTKGKVVMKSVPTAILGGGDMGFPLFFAGAVYAKYALPITFIIPVCALIALGALLTYGKKDKFYPAMPFISLGCFVGYAIILAVV